MQYRRLLMRYGYHGFGNPADDNGIVVFADDRVTLLEVVGEIPESYHQAHEARDFSNLGNVDAVREMFQRNGSEEAKSLAERVAIKNASERRR